MTYKDLWKPESYNGQTVTGTNTLDNMYQFGMLPDEAGTRIINMDETVQMNESLNAAVRSTDLSVGNSPLDRVTTSYVLVNGLPLYWMLGNSTATGLGHTISVLDTGRKPRISVYAEEDYSKSKGFGLVANSLDIEMGAKNALVMCRQSFKGMSHGACTDTPNGSFIDSVQTPYAQHYGYTWGGVDYPIEGAAIKFAQALTPLMGESGYYQEVSENANLTSIWTAKISPGASVTGLYTDWKAGTTRALAWTFNKPDDPTKTITINEAYAYVVNINKERVHGKPTKYEVTFVGEDPTATVYDGVTGTVYGD